MATGTTKAKSNGMGEESRFAYHEVGLIHSGKQIVLPGDPEEMNCDEAIDILKRKKAEAEAVVGIDETVDAYPWDGAIAFMKAMKKIHGWTSPVPTPGFWGSTPPTFVSVKTGPKDKDVIRCVWGTFVLPGIEGSLKTGFTKKRNRLVFCIEGEVKRKYQKAVTELADLTRKLAREESIYRGKAFKLPCDTKGAINFMEQPHFIDTSLIDDRELIFSKPVQEQIDTHVFAPIKNSNTCRRHKVPLKRSVLLEGTFGVGKTLTASVTAKICEQFGWTFITVDRVAALGSVLEVARLYAPALIFAEDIDRTLSGDRTAEMDVVLNTIDGVDGKKDEVITILTTNDVTSINQAMIRPGRLDAVISITPPDAEAAQRLMRVYGRGLIKADEKLEESGNAVAGQIPAVIREVVERAKLAAIARVGDGEFALKDGDLALAARGMKAHLDLLNRDVNNVPSAEEAVGIAIGNLLKGKAQEVQDDFLGNLMEKLEEHFG